jgi:hypothetical protein
LRRIAVRHGYRIVKSRSRNTNAVGYGGFMLIDVATGGAAVGGTPFPYTGTLEEIESFFGE